MLAMKATIGTELIQDAALIDSAGTLVSCKDGLDIFAFGSWTHNPIFLGAKSPVTRNMSQRSF